MARMLLGVFSDQIQAEDAISELNDSGISAKDISIIMKDGARSEIATETGSNVVGGAASGVATGGVLGGLAGLLIGVGVIALPGVGGLLIGGPIAIALGLTGTAATTISGAVTGALAGGLVGALVGWGVPEDEAKFYEDRVKEGAVLIAVPVNNIYEEESRSILEAHRADQIRSINIPTESVGTIEDRNQEDQEVYQPAYFEEVRKRRGK